MKVAIIGAGMAGASLAAEIAPHCDVVLVEAETRPGFHATGRSAAFWSETYGGPLIQPLTSSSRALLERPPADFSDRGFLRTRGAINLADEDGLEALDELQNAFSASDVRLTPLDRAALEQAIPGLRPQWRAGLWEPSCADVDVVALHTAYLESAARAGARLLTGARLQRATYANSRWRLESTGAPLEADVMVNAAGAWADEVACCAGVRPLGIEAFRRTVVELRTDPPASDGLPLVLDVLGRFYFKSEGSGRLWLTPQDETPCEAGDCAAEEPDVALALDRLASVVDWRRERVERVWAGLRSFAPDRLPVYGYDPHVAGFFWFAGQGGSGIQTAPAAAKLGAALLLGRDPESKVAGIDPSPYLPGRFAA